MNTATTLWYDRPSAKWTDALPLGNGSLGAMVYGGCPQERICLNLDTLWSGRPYPKETGDYSAAYRQAQALAQAGRLREAQDLIEEKLLTRNGNTYLPLGDLRLEFAEEGRVHGYTRSLDLKTGVHTVAFSRERTRWNLATQVKETCFVSYPDHCLVLRLTASEPVTVQATLHSLLRHECRVEEGALLMDVTCPGELGLMRNEFVKEEGGVRARVACAVQCDGLVKMQGGVIRVEGAKELTLYLTAESSFVRYDHAPDSRAYRKRALKRLASAQNKGYFDLLETHECDMAKYFDRVELHLGETDAGSAPTDQRLIAHGQGADDPSLYTLLFNYARYLMIAASRPGSQPMNLQGLWNERLYAPWAANYTVNINTEMNYWPALAGNLAEMAEPLEHMVQELSVIGRDTARAYYGAQGWCCHHNVDLWRQTFPAQGSATWGFWYNGGAWMSRHLYDHWLYTRDEAFLREKAYPVIRGCAEFYLSMLTDDGKGFLIMCPSTSPENAYWIEGGKRDCGLSKTTAMTMEIAREAMEHALSCAKALGADEALQKTIEETLPRLLPLRVGSDGRLMEWYDEQTDTEPEHRHVSHLYALHPAHQITPEDTPELVEACKKTLQARGDGGTGWSLGWKINFWARLRDGDHALRLLDNQLRYVAGDVPATGGGTYANLFDAHPPFQIDGNFGACSGIIEMLLQADEQRVHLLPALPGAWKEGSVRGLKAPGDVTVSLRWAEGRLVEARLESPIAQTVRVCWPGGEQEVRLEKGKAWTL